MIPVASYCRVSTDKDDQANSFESQRRYFQEYINRQPDWELYLTYADEGITGTSTKNRAAFNRMIRDARLGKFRLILTKEVSRFSRNILDTIAYTRELRQLGIGVLFMNDGINTLDPDAELRLSIMASIAQEESRKTSSRVKWGQTRQMERGVVFGRSLLGYDVEGGRLRVNPEGAEIVRLIFRRYGLEKKSAAAIARELEAAGCRTLTGQTRWSGSQIMKIIRNEKYVGDLVQKKTFTPDYLTHEKKCNHGEEDLVILRDHHEPLIDRELWSLAQVERERRNRRGEPGAGHSDRYLFSGKIKCGVCGASFVARTKKQKDGSRRRRWSCGTAAAEGCRLIEARHGRTGCDVGKTLSDKLAAEILRQTLGAMRLDRELLADSAANIVLEAIQAGERRRAGGAERLEREIARLAQKRGDMLDAFLARSITEADMALLRERYDREEQVLQARLEAARTAAAPAALWEDIRRHAAGIISGSTHSEIFYKSILDHMTVYKDHSVEVRLSCLPHRWVYVLERGRFDAPVPISVSSPFSSG